MPAPPVARLDPKDRQKRRISFQRSSKSQGCPPEGRMPVFAAFYSKQCQKSNQDLRLVFI